MSGYCGKCNKHYNCHWSEHKLECDEGYDPASEQGTPENFERERRLNNWDDEQAKEVWDKYYK